MHVPELRTTNYEVRIMDNELMNSCCGGGSATAFSTLMHYFSLTHLRESLNESYRVSKTATPFHTPQFLTPGNINV